MKKVVYIVKPGLTRVTFKALVGKARNSVTMMTGNPAFATPSPTLASVSAAADKLAAADEAYDFTRSKVVKEERDSAFGVLKSTYRDLGGYVQMASGGDKELILSADRDAINPFLMPEDAIACYDSAASDVKEVSSLLHQMLLPFTAGAAVYSAVK